MDLYGPRDDAYSLTYIGIILPNFYQFVKLLDEAPAGSRYGIYVNWGEKKAHVFIAEKVNDEVYYICPQTNVFNYDKIAFGCGKPNKFGYMRMDDKKIIKDKSVLKEAMRRSND